MKKRVLIVGKNSFLGNNIQQYLEGNDCYIVEVIDAIGLVISQQDFTKYDSIINVSAIVHNPKAKKELYYEINRDFAYSLAKEAKKQKVKQFIQISTNGVFGLEVGVMSNSIPLNPKTPYEKSKLQGDELISTLRDEKFKVCIIRPPLMYGNNCKGNFKILEKFSKKFHIFPLIENKRDFIFVKNMSDFIEFAIENEMDEICYPRDSKPLCTYNIVKNIAIYNNNKMKGIRIFNPIIRLLYPFLRKIRLIFGDNYCTIEMCSKNWTPPFEFIDALNMMYGEKDGKN